MYHREATGWREATVVKNAPASANGNARRLVLSVADSVKHLSGRKFGKTPSQERLEEPRWYDRFTTPGQCVALRQPGEAAGMPMALSSSPCHVRQESAFIDASLIEILVDPSMQVPSAPDASSALSAQAARLCALGPGDVLECSLPMGRGIASILSTDDLEFAIAEGQNILFVGTSEFDGHHGMGPIRSAVSWTPLNAHATRKRVTVVCHALSMESAVFVQEWDLWRENGIKVIPCIGGKNDDGSIDVVVNALFSGDGGLKSVVQGDPAETTVCISGFTGEFTSLLLRRFAAEGVNGDRVYVVDQLQ